MDAIFLTMGGILIPLGFYLKIELPSLDDMGTVTVIAGLVCWLAAYYFVKRKERLERMDRERERLDFKALLSDIRQELKGMRQDIIKRG